METTSIHKEQLLLEQLASFINETGIACRPGTLPENTFLPGIDIQNGAIIYDHELLKYPGDLLHEAGHLAVLLPQHRAVATSPDKLFGDLDPAAAELGAIAWSWAALKHLQIDPAVVFHEQGYKGGAANIMENFSSGHYMAVPLLQWLGMTSEPKNGTAPDEFTYPRMRRWLRQEAAND